MKRALQLLLVLALGAGALWLALREVHLDEFLAALRDVDLGIFALGFLSFFLLHILRSVRWGGLVQAVKPGVRFRSYLSICSVGFMLINILPFRLGEFARPYLLFEREEVPFGSGMATVLVERVLDVMALGAIFLGVLMFADVPAYTIEVAGRDEPFDLVMAARTGILGVLIPVGVAVTLLLLLGDRGIRLVERLRDRMPEGLLRLPLSLGVRFLGTFLEALRSLGSVRRAAPIVVWTAALWFLNILSIYFTVRAFAFGADIGFWGAATILVVICLALITPAPPGFAGVFEFACTVALAIFAVGPSEAAAFAVLLHGSQFVLVTGVGMYFVFVDKVSVRRLMDMTNELRSGGGEAA
ncbi:MAG: flippase-like domain-containing protein [Deltaproteobacteria bacterium]|nr:flippase-like domain-containing protein [Deltaproteobacteria bacterium]